jgi:hypothetical protein
VKVILIHGGKYYSSGNNLSVLTSWQGQPKEETRAFGSKGIFE